MKDPAFLFYPSDFNDGTQIFTHEEVGAYLRVLMLQFSQGRLPFWQIERKLGIDTARLWEVFGCKFKRDDMGCYYNERLESEQLKRANFTQSRRNNLQKKKKDKEEPSYEAPYVDPYEESYGEPYEAPYGK